MKDVQKGRKSWLERLTSPPEEGEDNEQYDDQTQAFQPFPPDGGPREGSSGDEHPEDQRPEDRRPEDRGGQDHSPEYGRRPEPGHDQERQAFGPGPHQQGSRVAGAEGRQPDDFDAAFHPRGLRTPPSDFRTGPQDRVRSMGRSPQAPGAFRPAGGDAEASERPGFRRTQPGSVGEPAWGGEPPQAPGGGAFGRHDAERPETGPDDAEHRETERTDAERPETGPADVSRPDPDRPDTDRPDTGLGEPQGHAPADREQEAAVDEVTERPFTGRADSPETTGRERDSWARPAGDHSSAVADSKPGRDRQDGPDSSDGPDVPALPDTSDVPNHSYGSDESDRQFGDRAGTDRDDALPSGIGSDEGLAGDGAGPDDSVNGHAERDDAEHRRRIDDLQQRWLDAQAKLLDDPRDAAHEAGLLVGEAMVFVTSTFTEHRERIERDWRDDADLGTDELLSIMRRYRSLFRSVLAASELPEDRR
ncbi:hypothetical protein SAMN05421678_115198 [Actinopolymorpha cephalotaxi]|uniref:Uncharacterized protein n=1 Tax=Actinopolymorpha cephalotaxi TaxID=504797 RepID=A0A1I2Z6H3_9ACTN|nr:hypothetical protein [Actinopolymorpha cephalotaxi]NYH81879.1 hypothetical protein [Actinopolymorpha cephalotaxi]SFH33185.1 hypothetical protein SAMN05421678_115198 [Actinopolymorpha cephalotaxi]